MGERFEDQLSETEKAFGARRRSALEGIAPPRRRADGAGLDIVEAERGVILLRAPLGESGVAEALQAAFGPTPEIGRARFSGPDGWLRLADDEAWSLCEVERVDENAANLRDALEKAAPGGAALVEPISDGLAILQVSGPAVRETLAKGAAVDLHPAAFGAGEVRRAAIGAVRAVFYPLEEGDADGGERFEILCPRSQAPALYRWLLSAGTAGVLTGAIPGARREA